MRLPETDTIYNITGIAFGGKFLPAMEYAPQAKTAGKTPAAAAKAWKIPPRYSGYQADPILASGLDSFRRAKLIASPQP
jgi:hypothetical protein